MLADASLVVKIGGRSTRPLAVAARHVNLKKSCCVCCCSVCQAAESVVHSMKLTCAHVTGTWCVRQGSQDGPKACLAWGGLRT